MTPADAEEVYSEQKGFRRLESLEKGELYWGVWYQDDNEVVTEVVMCPPERI